MKPKIKVTLLNWIAIVVFCATCTWPAKSGQDLASIPSSVGLYATAGETSVMAGLRSIFVKQGGDVFEAIPLPLSWDKEFTNTKIGCIELSKDGRYLFVGCDGANGLYRCELSTREWTPVLPAGADKSVSAIRLNSSGSIYIGTGGYAYSQNVVSGGLYVTSDNGNTWHEEEMWVENNKVSPKVVSIASAKDGTLFVSARGAVNGQFGVFQQTDSGEWKSVASIVSSAMECTDSLLYMVDPNSRIVWALRTHEDNAKPAVIANSYGVRSIGSWDADTVFFFKRDDAADSDTVLLYEQSYGLVQAIPIERTTNELPTVYRSSSVSRSLVRLGGGANIEFDFHGSADTMICSPNLPIVSSMIGSRAFIHAKVLRHGWFTIDTLGMVERTAPSLTRVLDWCKQSDQQSDENALCLVGKTVFRIHQHEVDSVVQLADTMKVVTVCDGTNDQIFVATNTNIQQYNAKDGTGTYLPMTGWPMVTSGDAEVSLPITNLFFNHGRIHAWASGSYTPVDTYSQGGLYAFIGDHWERADGAVFQQSTTLAASSANSAGVAIFAVQSLPGASTANPIVAGKASAESFTLIGDDIEVLPYLRTLLVTPSLYFWNTTYNSSWFVRRETMERTSTTEYGAVTHSGLLGNRILLATEKKGLLFIEDSVTTSEATSIQASNTSRKLLAFPNPVVPEQSVIVVRDFSRCPHSHRLTAMDLLGTSTTFNGIDCIIGDSPEFVDYKIQMNDMSAGVYTIYMHGVDAPCTHDAATVILTK